MSFEFDFSYLRSSIKYVELITAITATIYYSKYNEGVIKYFLVILWYTVINEFFAFFIKKTGVEYTIIYYNIYHLINFSFLFLLFKYYIKKKLHKRIVQFGFYAYLLSFFINMYFENYIYRIQTIPFFIASAFIITSIIFYFSQILKSDEVLYIKNNLLFYISIGYFFYLVGNIPIRIVRNYFYEIPNLEYILNVGSILSILMNICFIIGFVWSKKK